LTSAASSGVARGIIPGSVKLVRNSVQITNRSRSPVTAGIAELICDAKYGQLMQKLILIINYERIQEIKQIFLFKTILN
jgi:hypothetical protein